MRIALVGAECEENLAIRYIRSALEHRGHTVVQVAFDHEEDINCAARVLASSGAALAGFSMVFTYRAREFAELAARACAMGFAGHIVAGGHFAAFNAEAILRDVPAFDSVAVGEGEEIMCALAARLDDPARVPGLVWRGDSGEIARNDPAVKPPDLDTLPWPARKEPPDTYLGLPIANMLASRGCTHACSFCSIAAWHRLCGGARLRLRSPECVADEMAALYARGYRIFNFHDDNFFLASKTESLARFRRLGHALRERGAGKIAFAVKSRPDNVDEETFAYLKRMGLFRVFLGIEAGTAESLSRLGRGQSVDDNARALDIVNRLDLHVCFNLLLLNPDSTLEDFRANVAFLRDHARNPMNFCRTEVYSGTPLEKRLREQGRLRGTYWGYGYRIGDPRAQEVFELMYRGLQGRHYGDRCVHHLAMKLDYESHLLARFFEQPRSLRRNVKDFILRVNLSSCAYLEELADVAARGFDSDASRETYIKDLAARVQRENEAYDNECESIQESIHRAAVPARRDSAKWSRRIAASLAATIGITAATTGRTQMEEMVAVPPKEEPEPPRQPPGPPAKPEENQPPEGDPNVLRPQFMQNALPTLARYVQPAQDIAVALTFNDKGRVVDAAVFKGTTPPPAPPLTEDDKKKAEQLIKQLGADDFKTRDSATSALKEMGRGVIPQVRDALQKAQDPEVKARARQLIEMLDCSLDVPQRDEMLKYLRSLSFDGDNVKGKRFVLPFTASEVRRWQRIIRRGPHVFEMAPAPMD